VKEGTRYTGEKKDRTIETSYKAGNQDRTIQTSGKQVEKKEAETSQQGKKEGMFQPSCFNLLVKAKVEISSN
jgi:hypothetical protein